MRISVLLCTILFMISCNSGNDEKDTDIKPMTFEPVLNTLTSEEANNGWELLFDGTSTNGWHEYGSNAPGPAWKVADGNIYIDTSYKQEKPGESLDIVTDEEFENFDLKLEWKIDTNGNSGIIFYVHEDPEQFKNTYMSGPEMQVLDNNGHPDAKIIKHHAGDLYDLISCSPETVKPALEWNQVEIKCIDGKLDFYLNGENVVSTQMWDDNWYKMIAESKFKQWPGFGTYKKGRIALQYHDSNVWFRNIRIKSL